MTAQHYSDEQLLELPPDHEHLVSCSACTAALTHIQQLAATLVDEIVWDDEPLPDTPRASTVATLRSIATQMDAEDADAERYVAELLATPRELWLSVLAAHPHYRTPGLVRRLIAETYRLIDSSPADVVEISAVAAEIADNLDPTLWHGDTIPRLRGEAWRERAYTLYYVGRHVDALAAANRSAEANAHVAIAGFDSARLMLVKALILRELESYDEALNASRTAAAEFERFGDVTRATSAATFEAAIAYATRDYRRAVPLFERLREQLLLNGDLHALAITWQNSAVCYRELRDSKRALEAFGEAVRLFDDLGMDGERIRASWHIGRVLLAEAKYVDAVAILRSVKDSYARLQIDDKAALVAIDLAEGSLMLGRLSDVVGACRYAMDFYAKSGLAYTSNALMALSLMKEAADAGELTSSSVAHVRSYLERLPQQPQLLFARLDK
jgi:tetratricopeptide (TPR) repeat protein